MPRHQSIVTDKSWQSFQSLYILQVLLIAVAPLMGLRISKASHAFGILHKRLWGRHAISKRTKVKVYNACFLTVLLYASETWTTYTMFEQGGFSDSFKVASTSCFFGQA